MVFKSLNKRYKEKVISNLHSIQQKKEEPDKDKNRNKFCQ